MSARRAFEKMKDVIVAYPFGDTAIVEIHTRKPGVITEKLVKEMFSRNKELKFVSLSETVVEKAN